MNLDIYTKQIHQLLYESIKSLKQILIWNRGTSLDYWGEDKNIPS
jgi:hypothetical protein